jgi:hypothetical protein
MVTRDATRFWSKVDVRGQDECWPWLGGRFDTGYGAFWMHGNNIGAHRVALMMSSSPKSGSDDHALHRCDNPPCCNPRHLFWGTPLANVRDAIAKGRKLPHAHKLTARKVRAIHRSPGTQTQIADDFDVSRKTVALIKCGEAWPQLGLGIAPW